ncbi:MAG: helix-turn-helix transcriptional regulator [Christensenella sp.]|uniref:helix-turn-helix domain-containing protein n=1 Tax=Christensenella sp. TaxID=1935934 RepID=UPI002B20E4E3|nr:helix-turn-helix transcriptional regulator [Christensenella sp.]MEA5004713.1 helix-turn-helix transcriptional regulator [Christensenella sp.]
MNLKQIRNAQGLSVQKLADRTGLHRRTLQDIEKRDDCLVSNAILLADALGVTMDELCRSKNDEAVE